MDAPLFEIQNGVLTECRMSGEENMTVTIPDGVTSIGKNAFLGCGLLQSITIPDSVTSIGDKAFLLCVSLKGITIPDGVLSIGNDAFANCNLLQNIDVSESNSDYSSSNGVLFDKTQTILMKYPEGKKDLSYIIPDGVTSIGEKAFADCDKLNNITIPVSVISIGDLAFLGCESLKSITIPDSVISIGDEAFEECTALESLTIPDSVTSIGDNAFLICDSLQSIDVSESNSNYLSCDGVLFDKYKSILIKYPQGKKELSFMIPDGVKSIKQYAFDNCKSLRSITIPDSVKRIASDAFYHCDNLTILAPAGSYAIEYARDNGIKFKEI